MKNNLNETRQKNWKGSDKLTYVIQGNGNRLVECGNRYYKCSKICEELGCSPEDLKYADSSDILFVLKNNKVDSEGIIYEGGRYDWNHIDPITGMPKIKEPRPEEKIQLMSKMPNQSCWIYLLQNRVNLKSVGNIRFKRKVWFDRKDCTISSDKTKEDAVYFREARLNDGSYAHGWMFERDFPK